uniref:Uncharacterized protein n=1 Tax=Anguilla anguilla TaxID=7936 RepID=A0A0E9QVP7_ANGAN
MNLINIPRDICKGLVPSTSL